MKHKFSTDNQGLSSVEIQRGSSIENNNILELSQLQNVQSLRYKKPLMKTCSIATPKKLYASSIKIEILQSTCSAVAWQIFVLVHGTGHGGWCWRFIVPLLQSARHDVYTPTLTGLGAVPIFCMNLIEDLTRYSC